MKGEGWVSVIAEAAGGIWILKRVKRAWLDQIQWCRSVSPSITERERKKEREWWPLTVLNRGFHARDQTPSLFSTLSLRRKTQAPPSDLSPFSPKESNLKDLRLSDLQWWASGVYWDAALPETTVKENKWSLPSVSTGVRKYGARLVPCCLVIST